jgi:hypothetical protein
MDMIPVGSSNIAAIGYDDQNAILTIAFSKDNSIYEYYDVPQYEFDNLMAADSKGSYSNKHIYKVYRQQKIA